MKEINTIRLVNARNAEHYQFHADVSAVITAEFAAAQGIGGLREAYAALFADEDKARRTDCEIFMILLTTIGMAIIKRHL